jgi:hypothetical protein
MKLGRVILKSLQILDTQEIAPPALKYVKNFGKMRL